MSVLIKNMTMPYGCADCGFCGGLIIPDDIYCCDCPLEVSYGKNISDAIDNDTRADFCPLVEVKEPHGDLVDKDKLMQEFMDSDLDHLQRDDWKEVIQIVSDADVIIKAERNEE